MHLFLALTLSLVTWAGPLVVGKGAGEAEYSITFARASLPELLNQCFGPCSLNNEEKTILKQLIEAGKNPPKVEFKDKMGVEVFKYFPAQNEVWFNRDLLWLDKDKTKPVDEAVAVVLWTQVLAEQLKINTDLTHLQYELINILRAKILRSLLAITTKLNFQAMIWQQENSRLYIRDAELNNYDVTSFLIHLTNCKSPEKFQITSLRWEGATQLSDGNLELHLSASQTWRCGTAAERSRVHISMRALAPKFTLDLASIQANLEGE